MVHLLHRLYGVDAPVGSEEKYREKTTVNEVLPSLTLSADAGVFLRIPRTTGLELPLLG